MRMSGGEPCGAGSRGAALRARARAAARGCRRRAGGGRAGLPGGDGAATPVEEPVTEYLEMTGTVAASKSVNLVARVPGYLESVHFKDGDVVSRRASCSSSSSSRPTRRRCS